MAIAGANYREGIAFSPDGAMYVTPSGSSAISGGTISGTTFSTTSPNSGVPTILHQGGIPLIGLSSGSVAANGAISAITALPRVYPNAYCYFPANILATTIAAGWYYCTFSTTTAGVAFLNTYSAGVPTIPTSPTAVTDGKGAFTGDTGEETGLVITVPALLANSVTEHLVTLDLTNNANNKTLRLKQSGAAGTAMVTHVMPSVATGGGAYFVTNTNAVAKQISSVLAGLGNAPTTVVATVNTGVATTIAYTLQRATATDNMVLLPPIVKLLY